MVRLGIYIGAVTEMVRESLQVKQIREATVEYLEGTKTKGLLTLQSSLDSAFYSKIEKIVESYTDELHCPLIAEIKVSTRPDYLKVIKYYVSLYGETPRENMDDLGAAIDAYVRFGYDYFTDEHKALLQKLKDENYSGDYKFVIDAYYDKLKENEEPR